MAQTVLPNHVPAFATAANDLGAATPSANMTVRVWLQMHNSAQIDRTIEQLYDPTSPRYHQFLTRDQIEALHAPSATEAAAVQKFLRNQGLSVTAVGQKNLYVEATGSVSSVQHAFKVQLHNYKVGNRVVRGNNTNPTIDDATAGPLVATVAGLSNARMTPHHIRASTPDGKVIPAVAVNPNGVFYEGDCFRGVQLQSFSTTGEAAIYRGNRYGADIDNSTLGHLPPCGYAPQEMYTAYNLTPLYNKGLDGTGQGIVIVDAYGSTTMAADLATFNAVYGLPTTGLTIIGTPVTPTNNNELGWMDETSLDVEWAHAVAPGANIYLYVSPSDYNSDLAATITNAVLDGYGSVISNSYGSPESGNAPADFAVFESALKLAALAGVAVNFSSGDDGDYVIDIGYADVSYPASSKLATGVGGNTVVLNANDQIKFQAPWGTNITEIADTAALGNPPLVPPDPFGFQFGAGGGTSSTFNKPRFQSSLPGRYRQVPDISWVADPYTGVEIIYTDLTQAGNPQVVGAIGGTSVACPMFSGLWAIAAQKNGGPLGQAAPILYRLSHQAITDVTATNYGTNVTGVVADTSGAKKETARALATPTPQVTTFTSALYNSPSTTRWFVLSFGTDSSLNATPGWDNVTGLGTPNGYRFVMEAAGK